MPLRSIFRRFPHATSDKAWHAQQLSCMSSTPASAVFPRSFRHAHDAPPRRSSLWSSPAPAPSSSSSPSRSSPGAVADRVAAASRGGFAAVTRVFTLLWRVCCAVLWCLACVAKTCRHPLRSLRGLRFGVADAAREVAHHPLRYRVQLSVRNLIDNNRVWAVVLLCTVLFNVLRDQDEDAVVRRRTVGVWRFHEGSSCHYHGREGNWRGEMLAPHRLAASTTVTVAVTRISVATTTVTMVEETAALQQVWADGHHEGAEDGLWVPEVVSSAGEGVKSSAVETETRYCEKCKQYHCCEWLEADESDREWWWV